jgi:Fic family protein
MRSALDDWEKFLHEEPKMPHLMRCALIHYQFETIHPFLDGNGRLGRLLISFYLVERGILALPLLYVSPYLEARRPEYYDRLQRVRQRGQFEDWITFFLDAVRSQAMDAVGRAERLLEVFSAYRDRLRNARIRGGAVELVDQLLANPYMTTSRAAGFLHISLQGASYAINRLVDAKILEPSGRTGAARVFLAREVLEVLEAPQAPPP